MKTCRACGEINGSNRKTCYKCGRSLSSLYDDTEPCVAPSRASASSIFVPVLIILVVIAFASFGLYNVFSGKPRSTEERIADAGSRIRINTGAINSALETANRQMDRIAEEQKEIDSVVSDFVSEFNDLHDSIVDDLTNE